MQEINHSIFKQKLPTGMQLENLAKIFFTSTSLTMITTHTFTRFALSLMYVYEWFFLGVFQTLLVLFLF